MQKTIMITRLTSMPISRALVDGRVARMAVPMRVFCTNRYRQIIMTTEATRMRMRMSGIGMPSTDTGMLGSRFWWYTEFRPVDEHDRVLEKIDALQGRHVADRRGDSRRAPVGDAFQQDADDADKAHDHQGQQADTEETAHVVGEGERGEQVSPR